MLISEYLLKLAAEEDNADLQKFASEIQFSEDDKDMLEKDAAGIGSALLAGGKALMQNSTIRNAAVGAGAGAISGAATAAPGNRLSGAIKGGAIGGAVGGLGTVAKNVLQRPVGSTVGSALANEGSALQRTGRTAVTEFNASKVRLPGAGVAPTAPNPLNTALPTPTAAQAGIPSFPPKPPAAGMINPAPTGQRPGLITGIYNKAKSLVTGQATPYMNRR